MNKNTYYISNLGKNTVSIIDGEKWELIKEVQVGLRPCEITMDNKKNIYVATDRDDKIFVINHLDKTNKILDIPNNGYTKIDPNSNKFYVSNTEELNIYNLDNGDLIGRLKGFRAIDCIRLNSSGSKLFILDIVQNEIRVYDTLTLKLIKAYNNICYCPNYIFIGENERYLYIANKYINKGEYISNILILDLINDNILEIGFPKGSLIKCLEGNSNYLYAINENLGRIEVIDIVKNNLIRNIKTTLDYPQRMKISPDKNFLLATSIDDKGRGALDLINIKNNKIEYTFKFKENNCIPYDIAIINEEVYKDKNFLYSNLYKKFGEDQDTFILAKKIISTYKEKTIFKQVHTKIISEHEVKIDKINFEKCLIIEESKSKEFIRDKDNYIIFKFEFYIQYYMNCINSKKEKFLLKGNLKGKHKAILYISDNEDISELDFIVKAKNIITSTPYKKGNFLLFDVTSTIATYVTKEEVIFLPSKIDIYFKKGEV